MKLWPKKIAAGWVIAPLGIALFAVLVSAKPKPQANNEPVLSLPEVTVVEVEVGQQKAEVMTQGVVSAGREIELVSELPGKVTYVSDQFVGGGFISTGEKIISIDEADYIHEITKAKAHVAEAWNHWSKEKGLARRAQQEWKDLGSEDANNLFLRVPQLHAAETAYLSSLASLNQAEINLSRTKINSPFVGRVKEKYVDIGQYVSAGSKLAKIYDTSFVEIRLPLTDKQASLIDLPLTRKSSDAVKPTVKITGEIAGRFVEWEGEIVRVEANIDKASRVYFAIARVDNQSIMLKGGVPLIVGLFVNAKIEGRILDGVVALPREAVFHRNKILSLESGDAIKQKNIDLLFSKDETVWVKGELKQGDKIVVEKQTMLGVGDKVIPLIDTSKSTVDSEIIAITESQQAELEI